MIDPIDADAFGESAAFDRQGHPAIAYLVRTGTDDQAQVRLARLLGGKWSVETLDTTTYRVAPGGANASSVGLAFDHLGRPWVAFVDSASHSVRLVTPGKPSTRIGDAPVAAVRAVVSFGANDAVAVVAAGLVGDHEPLRLLYRDDRGRWRGDQVGESGSSAPDDRRVLGSAPRDRVPRSPERLGRTSLVRGYLRARDGAHPGRAPELARLQLARGGAHARRRRRRARVAEGPARVRLAAAGVISLARWLGVPPLVESP